MTEFANPCIFANYAVAFIDILGQRAAYGADNLVPEEEDAERAFRQRVCAAIGPIVQIQTISQTFLDSARRRSTALRRTLAEHLRPRFDDLRKDSLKTQNWSDGIVWFHSLRESEVAIPMNGVFLLLGVAGLQCLLGLSSKRPVRGGLEIAWATELRPGELYGCAVARAYELESEIAQYPRIVIGPYFCEYLRDVSQQDEHDDVSGINKALAGRCLDMIARDTDGRSIIDYLGAGFQRYISRDMQSELRHKALVFIQESLDFWSSRRDTKLLERYRRLLSYFGLPEN